LVQLLPFDYLHCDIDKQPVRAQVISSSVPGDQFVSQRPNLVTGRSEITVKGLRSRSFLRQFLLDARTLLSGLDL